MTMNRLFVHAEGARPAGADGERVQPDLASSTDEYAARFSGRTGAWLLSVQTGAILDFLASRPGAHVLDVGGGHAQVTPPLLERGHPVTALVSSERAGRRLAQKVGDDVAVIEGDLLAPPLPNRSADVVVAMRMVAHFPDWEKFIEQLCRLARDAVILDFARPRGVPGLTEPVFRLKKMYEGNTRRYATVSLAQVSEAFAAQGFEVEGHVGQFVLPMAAHRLLRRPGLSRPLEAALRPLAPRLGNPVILCARRTP